MTPEEIKRLRELCDAATKGPWADGTYTDGSKYVHGRVFMRGHENPHTNTRDCHLTIADAQFIAAAREAVPRLLDEVERLQAEVKAWQRDVLSPLSNENKALYEENACLRKALIALINDVDECLEELDPCEGDCADHHTLSLDSLPNARRALEGE